MAVNREDGVYSNNLDTKSIASCGVRGRKTYEHPKVSFGKSSPLANERAHLIEWMRLNLREFVFHVVRVHRLDLLSRWRSQNLDDFDQLINSAFTREEGLAEHEFRHHTTGRPNV